MTKELAQEGEITERDKVIFAAYQTSGSAIITNYFSSRRRGVCLSGHVRNRTFSSHPGV